MRDEHSGGRLTPRGRKPQTLEQARKSLLTRLESAFNTMAANKFPDHPTSASDLPVLKSSEACKPKGFLHTVACGMCTSTVVLRCGKLQGILQHWDGCKTVLSRQPPKTGRPGQELKQSSQQQLPLGRFLSLRKAACFIGVGGPSEASPSGAEPHSAGAAGTLPSTSAEDQDVILMEQYSPGTEGPPIAGLDEAFAIRGARHDVYVSLSPMFSRAKKVRDTPEAFSRLRTYLLLSVTDRRPHLAEFLSNEGFLISVHFLPTTTSIVKIPRDGFCFYQMLSMLYWSAEENRPLVPFKLQDAEERNLMVRCLRNFLGELDGAVAFERQREHHDMAENLLGILGRAERVLQQLALSGRDLGGLEKEHWGGHVEMFNHECQLLSRRVKCIGWSKSLKDDYATPIMCNANHPSATKSVVHQRGVDPLLFLELLHSSTSRHFIKTSTDHFDVLGEAVTRTFAPDFELALELWAENLTKLFQQSTASAAAPREAQW